MGWTPRYRHVSQLHPGPGGTLSGWNDCWEACLARYLRERDPAVCKGDDWALIAAISQVARGRPDAPDNPDTTLVDASRSLAAYGVAATWTAGYQDALQAPWAICLVDGPVLSPAQYPADWFGRSAPGGNHFILWLPFWEGSADWFDDPLCFANGQHDCQYDLGSVAAAFQGAYLLPSTGNGEISPAPLQVAARCGLKVQPNHTCVALTQLAAGARVVALSGATGAWQQVRTVAGITGWVPRNRLRAVGV
ncbi:MAG: hypothetical protein JWO42_3473 [Chloroflexi bacterium]|jgi:hypothetical protein|nr:hypothetical protein [Chloroflexota bacterium]